MNIQETSFLLNIKIKKKKEKNYYEKENCCIFIGGCSGIQYGNLRKQR